MPKQLIVDIDGVLCPIKDIDSSYRDLKPYGPMLERLLEWKEKGFQIILHSSRTMRTHAGDLSRINKHTAHQTIEWLEHWGIPYDGILFGKPWPGKEGFYIDDRAIRPREFLTCSKNELDQIIELDRADLGPSYPPPKANIVITMAGLGSRFLQAGYREPKYKIEVGGKSLFEWSISSLKPFIFLDSHLFFIVRRSDKARCFIAEQCLGLGIKRYTIIEIDALTNGQATTALLARSYWWSQKPLFIYNIDTYVRPESFVLKEIKGDGWVPCFQAEGDHWSFVRIDSSGNACEVREKQRISPYATIGLYWFSSASLFEYAYTSYYGRNMLNMEKGECYIAPLYNMLISKGMKVTISDLPVTAVHPLGTPAEVNSFSIPFASM